MTTTWQPDMEATAAARQVLPCAEQPPSVRTNGAGIYLMEPTPWRRVELVWWNDSCGFIVAAEQPPPCTFDARCLPLKLRARILQSGLKPWRLIRELARLPHAILTGRPSLGRSLPLVRFDVPGLDTAEEARRLIVAEHGDVQFTGSAMPLLLQAATVPDAGIVPGRLLTLLQVATNRDESHDGPLNLSPDDVVAAAGLLRGSFDVELETTG